ncbi:beta-xylosidase-like protein [Cavenderia fasciculata]|uniref:Beta-xylosidase-like protein n=1 Tax=Cavenderia fasciculata TaxID=261658 RepID=F4PX43_CACFS|nr:beta-xylosidase-like protein [Cavenderia fasciculata]EGG19846.1 beta-xylosidase-like protein [Cavenderia fasciculata]|eukprot:XP_004358192.1 beta-xylosidase-like protein [Cavenderia fasciculata]
MMKTIIVFLTIIVGLVVSQSSSSASGSGSVVEFTSDLSISSEWDHYWERCVGSGHAWLGTRRDWQDALKIAHDKLGFERVRFHGIFDNDMNVYQQGANGEAIYSWYNVDVVYDYLVSIGMSPFVELSFMPNDMASGDETIFHYMGNITPPKNFTTWNNLVVAFLEHVIDRYGITEVSKWHFEIWNEPNCGFLYVPGYANQTTEVLQTAYFEILNETFSAVKSVNADLSVGGPATCQSQWIPETLQYCKDNGIELDFVSTHEYPTDIVPLQRNIMYQVLSKSREIVGDDMQLFYSEYNDGLFNRHDTTYASAFAIFNIIDVYGLSDIFSWWTFSDVFEEQGQQSVPFNEGFGLQTIYNIAKPSFKAFELLHETGNLRYNTTGSHPTAGILVTNSWNKNEVLVLVYNHNIPDAPMDTETLAITLENIPSDVKKATIRRIDEDNCNPIALWTEMGSPSYPSTSEIEQLLKSTEFNEVSIPITKLDKHTIQVQLDIPPQGVAAIKLHF